MYLNYYYIKVRVQTIVYNNSFSPFSSNNFGFKKYAVDIIANMLEVKKYLHHQVAKIQVLKKLNSWQEFSSINIYNL